MIKILYIVSNLRRTGPTRQLLNIISNLDHSAINVSILSLSPEPEDSMIGDFRSLSVNISSLAMSRFKGFFFADKKVRHNILEIDPDIIHSQGIRPDMIAAKIQNRQVVSTIRNDPWVDYPMKFGKFIGGQMARKHLKTMHRMQNPVACSVSLTDDLEKKYGIVTNSIQNGVDSEKYRPASSEEKIRLREKLGLDKDQKYFLTVGSLIPRKNTSTLLHAFRNIPNGHLLILGAGAEKEKLIESAKGAKNIHFKGNVSNANEYMRAADFYLSASTGEGLPNTVLEALSSGLPVILSDIRPHKEIFADVDYAYYFPARDAEALIKLIGKMEGEDQGALRNIMRERAENYFSAKCMASKYQDLYYKLLS